MEIEVLSSGKPAVAWRGWFAAVLLFLVAGIPAGWLSWSRAGDLQHARVQPPGWDVSFRPPNRFEPQVFAANRAVAVYSFRRPLDVGFADVTIRRFQGVRIDASELCVRVLQPYTSLFSTMFGPPSKSTAKRLGTWDGIEVNHPAISMVVRAAVVDDAEGYAVTLRVVGGAIDESLYRSFEAVCDSLSLEPRRSGSVLQRGPARP